MASRVTRSRRDFGVEVAGESQPHHANSSVASPLTATTTRPRSSSSSTIAVAPPIAFANTFTQLVADLRRDRGSKEEEGLGVQREKERDSEGSSAQTRGASAPRRLSASIEKQKFVGLPTGLEAAEATKGEPTKKRLVLKLIVNRNKEKGKGKEKENQTPELSPSQPIPRRFLNKELSKRKFGEKPVQPRKKRRTGLKLGLKEIQPGEEKTICVSRLIREKDLQIMPSLEIGLTRRRRGSASKSEGLPGTKPRRKYSAGTAAHIQKVTNGISKPEHPPAIKESKEKETKTKTKNKGKEKEELESLERNIDNVIFGDVTFKAWYPSWYPKEIIGEKALSCEGKGTGITVEELYVCHKCFGYSKVLVEWVRHCRCCERGVPGTEIYWHGGDGVWSVWEVDGGIETVSFRFGLSQREFARNDRELIYYYSSSAKTSPSSPNSS